TSVNPGTLRSVRSAYARSCLSVAIAALTRAKPRRFLPCDDVSISRASVRQWDKGDTSMSRYLLLLHDDPSGFMSLSPDEMQKAIEKYIAWGDRLRASGVIVDGHKLRDEPGKVVRRASGTVRTTDGPHTESKEVLG